MMKVTIGGYRESYDEVKGDNKNVSKSRKEQYVFDVNAKSVRSIALLFLLIKFIFEPTDGCVLLHIQYKE